MHTARVPRYLHLPLQILACYAGWLVVDSWWMLTFVVLGPWLFKTIKSDKPRGFVQHTLVRYGFQKLHAYPPASIEHFWE